MSLKNVLTVLLLATFAFNVQPLETLDDGLVAHSAFEGDAQDSLGQHHGEIHGEPAFVPGPWGAGIYFRGDGDHISVDDAPDFSPGLEDFSVSAWFRFPAEFVPQHPGQFKNQILMIQQRPESFQWLQLAGWGSNGIDLERSIGFGLKSGSNASQTVARLNQSQFWDDQWHHVAGVRRDVHTLEIYIDGQLESIISNPILHSVETFSTSPMLIGYDPGYGGWSMVGGVDELRIYRRALSSEEVAHLATNPGALDCSNVDFDGGGLSNWALAGVGNANQEEVAIVIDDGDAKLALTADGATAYKGADNAGFLYRELTGDFRVETTVDAEDMVAGNLWAKTGLMVRASLDHWDIRLLAMLVPEQHRLQFAARDAYKADGNVKLGSEVTGAPDVVRLAIERSGQTLAVRYSLDGGLSWMTPSTELAGSIEIAELPETLLVGLAMVSNNISVPSTALFDGVTICR